MVDFMNAFVLCTGWLWHQVVDDVQIMSLSLGEVYYFGSIFEPDYRIFISFLSIIC